MLRSEKRKQKKQKKHGGTESTKNHGGVFAQGTRLRAEGEKTSLLQHKNKLSSFIAGIMYGAVKRLLVGVIHNRDL